MVGPQKHLYEKLGCRRASEVTNVQPDQPSRVLVDNINLHPVEMNPRQVVAMARAHPEKVVESDVTHAELLGLIPDDVDTKYRKRNVNVRDIDTINKHLGYEIMRHMGDDENPVTAEEIHLKVFKEEEDDKVRSMLRKHENMVGATW